MRNTWFKCGKIPQDAEGWQWPMWHFWNIPDLWLANQGSALCHRDGGDSRCYRRVRSRVVGSWRQVSGNTDRGLVCSTSGGDWSQPSVTLSSLSSFVCVKTNVGHVRSYRLWGQSGRHGYKVISRILRPEWYPERSFFTPPYFSRDLPSFFWLINPINNIEHLTYFWRFYCTAPHFTAPDGFRGVKLSEEDLSEPLRVVVLQVAHHGLGEDGAQDGPLHDVWGLLLEQQPVKSTWPQVGKVRGERSAEKVKGERSP